MAAVGFRDLRVEWIPRAENLRERFPQVPEFEIVKALEATDGHAGKCIKHLEQTCRASPIHAAGTSAKRPSCDALSRETSLRGCWSSEASDDRPNHLPSALDLPRTPPATVTPPPSPHAHPSWNKCGSSLCLLVALILSSLCTNAVFFWLRSSGDIERDILGANEQNPEVRTYKNDGDVDTDGDGIPDHHDFCPLAPNTAKWTSGKATDFDGDGCQDGVEDPDRDNDGVHDPYDDCPRTPMSYSFVSNLLSDFDRDGCADSIEDPDNDNDTVPNSLDACPKTEVGEASDSAGCSIRQLASATKEEDHRWWEVIGSSCKTGQPNDVQIITAAEPSEDDTSWWKDWIGEIKGAWAEIFVGAILTTALTKVNGMATGLQQVLPKSE